MQKLLKTLIMIPTYNGEKFIERTLKSCINQTLLTEIWVVDNQSKDSTRKIINKYAQDHKNIKLFINEKNLGRTGNWNRCLELFEKSSYEYLKFVFTGDEIFPNCIKKTEKIFSIDKDIGAVAFPYEFKYLDGHKSITIDYQNNTLFNIKQINWLNIANGGILGAIICNVYNKKFIQGYRFNEIFIGKADFDNEILSRSKAYYLNEILARFNQDARKTFPKSKNNVVELEVAFNKAYRLEKIKKLFSQKEYDELKKIILLDLIKKIFKYYKTIPLIHLWKILTKKLIKRILKDIIQYEKIKKNI